MAAHFFAISFFAGLCASSSVPQYSSPGRLTGTNFGIPSRNATYDYVVAGGGTAGLVVAARLTQHSNATVAIIEAGNFYELSNGNWSQIPYWHKQWRGGEDYDWQPLIDWGLMTEPQLSGQRLHYAQGRNLGGSSGRNQMLYHRATKGLHQAWADRVGDRAYTWDNMLKYMQRSVKYQVNGHRPQNATPTPSDNAYSADGGPLCVTYPATVDPFSVHAAAAFGNIGLKMQNDFNGGEMSGYGY